MDRICRILVPLCLLATATSMFRVYPHQLAYFNEIAGGPENGYKHLLGSSFDWGQDVVEAWRIFLQISSSHPAKRIVWLAENIDNVVHMYPKASERLSRGLPEDVSGASVVLVSHAAILTDARERRIRTETFLREWSRIYSGAFEQFRPCATLTVYKRIDDTSSDKQSRSP